jgi:predicted metal-dependent hydrolase
MIAIDSLIRSRRKTIALIITREGKLVVRAPLRASRAQIDALVIEKSTWIRAHQSAMLARPQPVIKQFIEGEVFFYLGQAYALHFLPARRKGLELREGHFQLGSATPADARQVLMAWYKRQARTLLEERVRVHAARLGYLPGQVRISSARTRWGSCSSSGTLSFTWRLVMAPLAAIDYVVVHELVHLSIKNHSQAFWKRVAEAYPGWAAARQWLKQNSGLGDEFFKGE